LLKKGYFLVNRRLHKGRIKRRKYGLFQGKIFKKIEKSSLTFNENILIIYLAYISVAVKLENLKKSSIIEKLLSRDRKKKIFETKSGATLIDPICLIG